MPGAARRSDILLRAATPGDCDRLSALCLRSKAHWGYDAAFLEACRAELSIHPQDIGSLLRVAEVDGTVAGVAQLAHDGEDWAVEKLFVDPPFIGRGVGAVLMGWMVDAARSHSAERLVIEADPGAASFYRRFGAEDAGRAQSGSIPGRFIPRLVLDLG